MPDAHSKDLIAYGEVEIKGTPQSCLPCVLWVTQQKKKQQTMRGAVTAAADGAGAVTERAGGSFGVCLAGSTRQSLNLCHVPDKRAHGKEWTL